MFLRGLHLVLSTILSAIALALNVGVAEASSIHARPPLGPVDSNLSLHSLPNPYPVPERDFSLRFLPPLQALPKATVELCISQTFHRLIRHIRKYGDGQIPMILRIQTKTVELYVYRGIADLHLSYNDTVAIVEVLDLKLKHDGWKELFAHIELTTQVHVVQLGIAGIRRM